ncbi:MAG: preprotein translocase subunit SecG [Candidatus Omnitrophica bacterium]|nr:preprotein translocase subunit SecG [Candidatus Omnitrophota bacterium]
MYILLIIFHIMVCLVLIAVILLQAGKGGGLTEAFGGEASQSVLGTQAPVILKKATTVAAVLFLITSLVLGIVTARRGRSLFDNISLPLNVKEPLKKTDVSGQDSEKQTEQTNFSGKSQPNPDVVKSPVESKQPAS